MGEHVFDNALVMSTLRSAVEEYRNTDVRRCPAEHIEADVVEMKAVMGGLEVECARRVAELERRRAFQRDGHLSMASWVETKLGTSFSQAAREVRLARGLEEMPDVREALSDGEVSPVDVGLLVGAREASPGEIARPVARQMGEGRSRAV